MSPLALFAGFLLAGACLVPFLSSRLRAFRWVGYLLEGPVFMAVLHAAGTSWAAAVPLGAFGAILAVGGVEFGLRMSEPSREEPPPASRDRGRGW